MNDTPMTLRRSRWPAAVGLLAAAAWACADVTDIQLLQVTASGVLFGQAYVDLDGNGVRSAGDEPLQDASVALVTGLNSEPLDTTVTDSLGFFLLTDVLAGSYLLVLDSALLGDSLTIIGAGDPFPVAPNDTSRIDLGAGYAELSLEEAVAAPAGRRIFTSGIALNSRLNFGDGQVHFRGDSAFLRGLNVERGAVQPGDSVRLLGRRVTDNGRPALNNVTLQILVPLAELAIPAEVSTGLAAGADGGAIDAALVRIRDAEITDTSTTVDGHFRFWADDGTDSIEFVIRDFLVPSVNKSLFRPDTVVRVDQAIGLLSPYDDGSGSIRWRLLPRASSDIALETKFADVAITNDADTAQAVVGDTLEFTVTASNSGPFTATGLIVNDTIPTGVSFLSATTTRGTYESTTGVWDLGSLAMGAADTLRLRVEVIGPPGNVFNWAELVPILREVDPFLPNNASIALVMIS